MPNARIGPNAWLWTIAALAGLTWGVIAFVFAAIGPSEYVPRVFFSYHIEHFVAFYLITLLAAAGLPRASPYQLGLALALMAVIVAAIRLFIPRHRLSDAEDLAADIAGIGAVIAPILVGRVRQIIAARPPPEPTPPA
jgi:VanZ family protein